MNELNPICYWTNITLTNNLPTTLRLILEGGTVETIAHGATIQITGNVVDFAQLQGNNYVGLKIGGVMDRGANVALTARLVNDQLQIA